MVKIKDILGINARSSEYLRLNKKRARLRADDKLLTKKILKRARIPHPKLLGKLKTQVGIEIHSGKNRIVHRMFEHLGFRVEKLDRVLYAGLDKKGLKRGESRNLKPAEVRQLNNLLKKVKI